MGIKHRMMKRIINHYIMEVENFITSTNIYGSTIDFAKNDEFAGMGLSCLQRGAGIFQN
ncbi:unnamed protein product [Onchocerca flexuosa]|uniref:Ribonucleoside-diphosphate reductase n=1 Tax=Onchocerca flexuosa TaxID=387005 RepID=A0A183HZN9_9BILA|nr:unnamed protein product [Onchocerca flexuosa]